LLILRLFKSGIGAAAPVARLSGQGCSGSCACRLVRTPCSSVIMRHLAVLVDGGILDLGALPVLKR
jgi:hypothetical protein